jgi:hypothetical protein
MTLQSSNDNNSKIRHGHLKHQEKIYFILLAQVPTHGFQQQQNKV